MARDFCRVAHSLLANGPQPINRRFIIALTKGLWQESEGAFFISANIQHIASVRYAQKACQTPLAVICNQTHPDRSPASNLVGRRESAICLCA